MQQVFPASKIDINTIVEEFENKLGVAFNRDKHGVGISNANKNLLDWKYCEVLNHIIHCYKAVNVDYAKDIKKALVDKGAFSLLDDNIEDKIYKERPLFVFVRNLRPGESSQSNYEG